MYEGMVITNPKVIKYVNIAELCDSFHCLPSALRNEDPTELSIISFAIQQKRKAMNPFKGGNDNG